MLKRDKDGNITVEPATGKYTRVDGELVEVGALHRRAGELAAREHHAPTERLLSQALDEAKGDWPEGMSHIDMFNNLIDRAKFNSLPKKRLRSELAELARKKGRRVIGDRTRP